MKSQNFIYLFVSSELSFDEAFYATLTIFNADPVKEERRREKKGEGGKLIEEDFKREALHILREEGNLFIYCTINDRIEGISE